MFPSDAFTIESHHLYDGTCTDVVHSTFIAAGATVADAAPGRKARWFSHLQATAVVGLCTGLAWLMFPHSH